MRQISRPSVVPQKDSLLATPSTSGHTADTTMLSAWRWPSDDEVGILTDAFKYCKPVEVSMNEKALSIKAVGDEEDRKEGEG